MRTLIIIIVNLLLIAALIVAGMVYFSAEPSRKELNSGFQLNDSNIHVTKSERGVSYINKEIIYEDQYRQYVSEITKNGFEVRQNSTSLFKEVIEYNKNGVVVSHGKEYEGLVVSHTFYDKNKGVDLEIDSIRNYLSENENVIGVKLLKNEFSKDGIKNYLIVELKEEQDFSYAHNMLSGYTFNPDRAQIISALVSVTASDSKVEFYKSKEWLVTATISGVQQTLSFSAIKK